MSQPQSTSPWRPTYYWPVLLLIGGILGLCVLPTRAAGPTFVVNTGLTLAPSTTSPITSSQLQVKDDTALPADIAFTVSTIPTHGVLRRGGVPITTNQQFTQNDINTGQLTYTHNGDAAASDAFGFAIRSLRRVSLASNGVQADSDAVCSATSYDGRYVAFHSRATTLIPNDTNGKADVFVHDRETGQTTRVSVASDGTQGNGDSFCASVSADGRYVAFQSDASNLLPGNLDQNTASDVFVHDRQTGQTERVSVSSSGTDEANGGSFSQAISSNGRYVVFGSAASNLVSGDTNGQIDVFVYDRQTGATSRESVRTDGTQANGYANGASISADGRYVAFSSAASNLVSGDTNTCAARGSQYAAPGTCPDMFLRDRQTGQTSRISVRSDGTQGNDAVLEQLPGFSADGRFIVFQSFAGNLVSGGNGNGNIFLYDQQTAQTTCISVNELGLPGNNYSSVPTISADGRYVGFLSYANDLVNDGGSDQFASLFLRDRQIKQTTRISLSNTGTQANAEVLDPFIAGDGRSLTFSSSATNLVRDDTNGTADIFVTSVGFTGSFTFTLQQAPTSTRTVTPAPPSTPTATLTPLPQPGLPTITTIADQTILENTSTAPLAFSIGDSDTPLEQLTISAVSSNPALVPLDGLIMTGSGAQRTLTITPRQTDARTAPTQQGSATVTLRVSDGQQVATSTFVITVTPPTWLALLALNGDDVPSQADSAFVSLSQPMDALLTRLNTMPYNPAVRLVILYDGNQPGGDSRVFVRDPHGLTDVTPLLAQAGSVWAAFPSSNELDLGSPTTIRAFAQWTRTTYPGSPYSFLTMVDHGGGWAPDFADPPGQPRNGGRVQAGGWRGMNIDITNGGTSLSTHTLGETLQGAGHFDVVFFDACLMGMAETAYEVRDSADYLIAGENQLFASLPYDIYFSAAHLTNLTLPRVLATTLVEQYNSDIDSRANPVTLAALDLRQLRGDVPDNLAVRVNTLAERLLNTLPPAPVALDQPVRAALTSAYNQAQKFDYDTSLTLDPTDGYVDLADFARRLRDSSDPALTADVKQAAAAVVDAILGTASNAVVVRQRAVSGVYRGQAWNLSGATGLSIFLPLGEQDYRPTRVSLTDATQPAQPERQLAYYANPTQLAWTRDVPQWAALLIRLEANTPLRAPTNMVPEAATFHPYAGVQRPFHSPTQLRTQRRMSLFLPLVRRS